MDQALREQLWAEVRRGGAAYVRNVTAAETAIYQGQFNVAKILRAAGHAQRVLAMNAARLLQDSVDAEALFTVILGELKSDNSASNRYVSGGDRSGVSEEAVARYLERADVVRSRAEEILRKGIQSLTAHPDVLERDVDLFIFGCHGCGNLVESERPETCDLCGAPSVEFLHFGPYYSETPEHLGRLLPDEVLAILSATPAALAEVVNGVDDSVLERRPTADEWSAKEIIGHLIETDRLFLRVMHEILETEGGMASHAPHERPWKTHEGKGYEVMAVGELLDKFEAIRAEVLELVQTLSTHDWSRFGSYPGRVISVMDRGRWLANHDVGHLAHVRNRTRGQATPM